MQECDFEIELILANDCSKDKTDEVIKNILKTHPKASMIKYFKHEQNIGMMPNFIYAINQCKGKYIALCEGDDYWTDPLKLQKQVDFLEANPEYNICFHEVKVLNQETGALVDDTITRQVPETTDIRDLAIGNFIHTPSVVLRNNFKLPNWLTKSPVGDWPLYCLAVKDKKIKKIEEVMAIYRTHETSIWSKSSSENRIVKMNRAIQLVRKNISLSKEVRKILDQRIGKKNIIKTIFKKIKKLLKKLF